MKPEPAAPTSLVKLRFLINQGCKHTGTQHSAFNLYADELLLSTISEICFLLRSSNLNVPGEKNAKTYPIAYRLVKMSQQLKNGIILIISSDL